MQYDTHSNGYDTEHGVGISQRAWDLPAPDKLEITRPATEAEVETAHMRQLGGGDAIVEAAAELREAHEADDAEGDRGPDPRAEEALMRHLLGKSIHALADQIRGVNDMLNVLRKRDDSLPRLPDDALGRLHLQAGDLLHELHALRGENYFPPHIAKDGKLLSRGQWFDHRP